MVKEFGNCFLVWLNKCNKIFEDKSIPSQVRCSSSTGSPVFIFVLHEIFINFHAQTVHIFCSIYVFIIVRATTLKYSSFVLIQTNFGVQCIKWHLCFCGLEFKSGIRDRIKIFNKPLHHTLYPVIDFNKTFLPSSH